jgi:hypothetical protein
MLIAVPELGGLASREGFGGGEGALPVGDQVSEWLVVNEIFIEGSQITVGATNRKRWDGDRAEGLSGADARTIVWVTLTDNGPGYVVSEEVGLFCVRSDPLRKIALGGISALLEVVWRIKERGLNLQQARQVFFGHEIR